MHWYYEERGTQVGPLTEDQFQNAVTTGRVGKDTLVWNESLTVWTQYGALSASPPAIPAPSQTAAVATQSCSQCGRNFQQQDLIQYGGLMVCAGCKPTFFQRLKEEGRVAAIW